MSGLLQMSKKKRAAGLPPSIRSKLPSTRPAIGDLIVAKNPSGSDFLQLLLQSFALLARQALRIGISPSELA